MLLLAAQLQTTLQYVSCMHTVLIPVGDDLISKLNLYGVYVHATTYTV